MLSPEQIADRILGYDATGHDGRLPSEPEQIEALIVEGIRDYLSQMSEAVRRGKSALVEGELLEELGVPISWPEVRGLHKVIRDFIEGLEA